MTETAALPSNAKADQVDAVIHTVVMQVALSAALTAAESAQPWLNTPVVRQVFEWLVTDGFSFIDKYIEQAAAFAVMDAQTSAEAQDYQTSVKNLKAAQASGNQDAIEKAKQDFRSTLSKLIHYDGN